MLQRLYVHNFRCLENFEFKPGDTPSALLIGKNGSGKSTLANIFKLFQAIGRGTNRVGLLVASSDFTLERTNVPIRLEIETKLSNNIYRYTLVLDLPERFRELRVLEETLVLNDETIYSRELAQVTIKRQGPTQSEAKFNIDWHLIALPVIQDPSSSDALSAFRSWLANMILLAPNPRIMGGYASGETLEPEEDGKNFSDWLSGVLAQYPAAYSTLTQHLQDVMPDLAGFRFERVGKDAKSLLVNFKSDSTEHEFEFDSLSDGEKCFFLCAVVLAANHCYGPLFAFWDEPDNYLALSEVSHFVMALRQGFYKGGQIIMTSHNEEAVRRFSNDNTWVIGRRSHLEPSIIRLLEDLPPRPDVIQSLIYGDLEP
ncbi:AAA family ATPase [Pseudomonas sp. 32_A]|uniref:AAA family ATPase n=1 Tax=Pseudomonas sp. 32_A TaxID=2813559 RepID=UPI001A9EC5BE|nr:AAA family ATPase [Pseudomonas sp. 32_A]